MLRKETIRGLAVLDLARARGGMDAAAAPVAGDTGRKECNAQLAAAKCGTQVS